MTRLISAGHPPHLVWSYTPRQLHAHTQLLHREECRQFAALARIMRGANAEPQPFKKMVQRLDKEAD